MAYYVLGTCQRNGCNVKKTKKKTMTHCNVGSSVNLVNAIAACVSSRVHILHATPHKSVPHPSQKKSLDMTLLVWPLKGLKSRSVIEFKWGHPGGSKQQFCFSSNSSLVSRFIMAWFQISKSLPTCGFFFWGGFFSYSSSLMKNGSGKKDGVSVSFSGR